MASKAKKDRTDEIFGEIMTGLSEATSYAKGVADKALFKAHVPETVDVAAIRKKTGLSQAKFADTYGFSAAAIRDYEQDRRTPDSAVRAYLMVIDEKAEDVRTIVYAITAKKKPGGGYEVLTGKQRYQTCKRLGYQPHVVRKLGREMVELEMRRA
jgi:putative transcriptional regulator